MMIDIENFARGLLSALWRATATAAALLMLALHTSAAEKLTDEVYTDIAGQPHRLPGSGECRVLALVFVAHDCPMSNAYAPEIARLCKQFAPSGAAFRIVYAQRDLAQVNAARHAKEFAFPCPAILDRELRLAARVGATMTPQAALLSPEGALLYLGRVDDMYADFGRKRAKPGHRDLRDALEAVLAGRTVAQARTPSLGCHIDFGPRPRDGR